MARKEKGRGKDKIQEIVKDRSAYWVGDAASALSSLFQQLLVDKRHVNNNQKWDFYMERYVKDPRNKVQPDHRSITSTRSNMLKELFKKRMSWKVFCKGFVFLMAESFEIQITVRYKGGGSDIIVQNVELNEIDDENFFIPDTERDSNDD